MFYRPENISSYSQTVRYIYLTPESTLLHTILARWLTLITRKHIEVPSRNTCEPVHGHHSFPNRRDSALSTDRHVSRLFALHLLTRSSHLSTSDDTFSRHMPSRTSSYIEIGEPSSRDPRRDRTTPVSTQYRSPETRDNKQKHPFRPVPAKLGNVSKWVSKWSG